MRAKIAQQLASLELEQEEDHITGETADKKEAARRQLEKPDTHSASDLLEDLAQWETEDALEPTGPAVPSVPFNGLATQADDLLKQAPLRQALNGEAVYEPPVLQHGDPEVLKAQEARQEQENEDMRVLVTDTLSKLEPEAFGEKASPADSLLPWSLIGPNTGCKNWQDIKLGEDTVEEHSAACGMRCQRTKNCVGFNFYDDDRCEMDKGPAVGHSEFGTCSLWKGTCYFEVNGCWSNYELLAAAVAAKKTFFK